MFVGGGGKRKKSQPLSLLQSPNSFSGGDNLLHTRSQRLKVVLADQNSLFKNIEFSIYLVLTKIQFLKVSEFK